MPQYEYMHPETGEIVEIAQGMNDEHSYIEGDTKWVRLFSAPNTSIDTAIDEYSPSDFNKKTHKNMTIGEIMDLSSELSEKRASKDGEDPIKRKFFNDYSKKNNGLKHLHDTPKEVKGKGITAILE